MAFFPFYHLSEAQTSQSHFSFLAFITRYTDAPRTISVALAVGISVLVGVTLLQVLAKGM